MNDLDMHAEALVTALGQEVDHFRLYLGPGLTQAELEQGFHKAVALAAYRRWAETEGRKPVGIPGNRDPDNPCESYAPRGRKSGDWADCQSDGHYLCQECCHLDPKPRFEDERHE